MTPTEKTKATEELSVLLAQYEAAKLRITFLLAETAKALFPTTVETCKWYGKLFEECARGVTDLAKAADLELDTTVLAGFSTVRAIELGLQNAEKRVHEAMLPFKLDELPPGEPKEPEFERLLKKLHILNKAYAALQMNNATLVDGFVSPLFKFDLTELDRAKAWQAERTRRLQEELKNVEFAIAETGDHLRKLTEAKTSILKAITKGGQMKFLDMESEVPFDPEKP